MLSKMLTNNTKRRCQPKYLKLLQLVHDAEKDLTIRPKEMYAEVMRNREKFAKLAEDPAPKKRLFRGFQELEEGKSTEKGHC